jgi:hypothetical protein
MTRRLVATLLVVGIARTAYAQTGDGAAAPAPPPDEKAEAVPSAPPPEPGAAAPATELGLTAPAPPIVAAPPRPVAPPPPAPIVAAPAVVVEPLAPAPSRVPGGAGPLLAGALTAFVPFVAGCVLWAGGRPELEKAGTAVMVTGFAAAPWVSHGLERRWKRAAIFGGVSTAMSAGTLVAMQVKDPFNPAFLNRQRIVFGVFLTAALFAAVVGVADSFLSAPAREAP